MGLSDTYNVPPRVNSSHLRAVHDQLIEVSNHLNFRHPIFTDKIKRSRSAGAAQAFIVELALSDPKFREKLRKYMVRNGEYWTFVDVGMPRYE